MKMLRIALPQILRQEGKVGLDCLGCSSSVLFLSGFKMLRGGFHITKSLPKMRNNS